MTEKKKEKSLNIFQRMNAAQKKVSYVQKNKPNGMKYSITSHDDVTAKVRDPLVEVGVLYYPTNMVYEQVGNRTQVFLQLKFCNIDDTEDFMFVDCLGYGIDAQDKGPGKAVSYAVKYGLLKAMGLKTGDDADLDSVDHKEDEKVVSKEPEKLSFRPKDGLYHTSALTVMEDRVGTPDMLFHLILTELKQAKNASDMWSASTYAPPKDNKSGAVGSIYLLKKNNPELYAELRTEAASLFGSEQ